MIPPASHPSILLHCFFPNVVLSITSQGLQCKWCWSFCSISKDSHGKLLCTGLVKPSTPTWGNVKSDLCNTSTVQRQNISSGFSTTAQFHCCTPGVWLFQPQSYYRLLFHIKSFFSPSYSHLRLTVFYNSFSRFFTNLLCVPVWRE